MKAITNSERTSTYGGSGIFTSSAKITKHKRDVENEEIRVYLSKLKELVPFMPKNRRLSRLEVIQYVIDYICDLQHALETHTTISSVAVHSAAAAAVVLSSASQATGGVNLQMLGVAAATAATTNQHRQPLGVLPSNANIRNISSISESSYISSITSGNSGNSSSSNNNNNNRLDEMVAYSAESCKSIAY